MITLRLDVQVSTASLEVAGSRLTRAMSDAIADTLKAAQSAQRRAMDDRFTIRRKPFRDLSVKVTEFPKRESLRGELAIRSPGGAPADRSNVFSKFERGGTKRPRDGKFLAVPIIGSPAKPTKQSVVPFAWRPSQLLARGISTPLGGRAFLRNTARGGRVLLVESPAGGLTAKGKARTGKSARATFGPRRLIPVYLFIKQAPVPAELDFVQTVTRTMQQQWSPAFAKRWAEQVARATR